MNHNQHPSSNPDTPRATILRSLSPLAISIPHSLPHCPQLHYLRSPAPWTTLLAVPKGGMNPSSSLSAPISPVNAPSDLGSSRGSITTTASSCASSSWAGFRDSKKSSSDFTDADSSKDIFSPSILLSPAPYSPFSDTCEAPASSAGQRFRFNFDPKSPSFFPLTPSRSSHFLLPPAPNLADIRERSRSDSDTATILGSPIDERSPKTKTGGDGFDGAAAAVAPKWNPRRQVDGHKRLYKKRLLRKYKEETGGNSECESEVKPAVLELRDMSALQSTNLPTIIAPTMPPSPPATLRPSASLSSLKKHESPDVTMSHIPKSPSVPSYTISPFTLPHIRSEPPNFPSQPPQPHIPFGMWLRQQVVAMNSIWPSTDGNYAPLCSSLSFPAISSTLQLPQRNQPVPSKPDNQTEPDPVPIPTEISSEPIKLGSVKSRRSRSESDMSCVCQHCGQSFGMHDRLVKHIASRHRDLSGSRESPARNHKCHICGKAFGRSDMLTRHMRLHTGIKPYSCSICGQVFSRSDHLATHNRTHTGEKPYQCPQCPYAANRRDMITRHMRTHTRPIRTSRPLQSNSPSSADSTSSPNIGYVSVIRCGSSEKPLLSDRSSLPLVGEQSKLERPELSADSERMDSASILGCTKGDEEILDEIDDET